MSADCRPVIGPGKVRSVDKGLKPALRQGQAAWRLISVEHRMQAGREMLILSAIADEYVPLADGERSRQTIGAAIRTAPLLVRGGVGSGNVLRHCPLLSGRRQRLVEVADQVFGGFEADREAGDIRAGADRQRLLVARLAVRR